MKIKILHDRAIVPRRSTPGSAAVDLHALIDGGTYITRGEVQLIPTGIAIYIEDPKIAGIVLPRSGLGHKGLVLGNGTGLFDSDYQGEVMISAWNRSKDGILIQDGDRIAQMIFVNIAIPNLEIVEDFDPTWRGKGGFGSTGV